MDNQMTFTSSHWNKRIVKKGFTLIELLVVISIIAFLSSVVIATTNTARAKARDAKKLSDAKQVSTAMEMWYSDNKTMPSSLDQLVSKGYLSQVPDNFTYKVATSSGIAVAYTSYETKNTPTGVDQQVGAVLVDDQSSGNLCDQNLSLGFPTCRADSNGNLVPLDQVVDVNNGEVIDPQGPTATLYFIPKSKLVKNCRLNETKVNGICECNPNETRVNGICACNDGYFANQNGMGCHLPCPPPPNGYTTVTEGPDGSCSTQQIGADGGPVICPSGETYNLSGAGGCSCNDGYVPNSNGIGCVPCTGIFCGLTIGSSTLDQVIQPYIPPVATTSDCSINGMVKFGNGACHCPYLQWVVNGSCVPAMGPFGPCGSGGYNSQCLCQSGYDQTNNSCLP